LISFSASGRVLVLLNRYKAMDFVKNLLSDSACNVDGTLTSRNPVSAIVDRLFDSAMLPGTGMLMAFGGGGNGTMSAGSDVYFTDANRHQYDPYLGQMPSDNLLMNTGRGFEGDSMQMQQLMQQQQLMHIMHQQQSAVFQQQSAMMHQQAYEQQLHMQSMAAQREMTDQNESQLSYDETYEHEQFARGSRQGVVNDDNLGLETLEDIWEQFQEQNKQDHEFLVENDGASKSGLDQAWADIQDRIVKQGLVQASSYHFAIQNRFLAAHQAASLAAQQNAAPLEDNSVFEEGLRLFRLGDIPQAILAFEAAVQSRQDHSECWRMLGMCHAENDMDKAAITCLRKAIDCDPYSLDALLALGTCYVNELNSAGALAVLKEWVLHHPTFFHLTPVIDEYSDGSLMDEVMQVILAAHKHDPEDVDVKILLGVLYNVSQDFEQAAQLFREALEQRPHDYTLYNKLGATLANSSRSLEAVSYYQQSLRIRPTYARGLLNLGISYANLNQYEEAARSYVKAIQQNPDGKHMWGYLRVVFTCLEDLDAVELCGMENIDALIGRLGL
jgi:peroxin-5